MRIAAITTSFLPRIGGGEFVVHHLARHWSIQGHEVEVFNQVADQAPPGVDYRVRRYRTLRGMWRFGPHRFPFRIHAARQLERLVGGFRPDFVSVHFAYPVAIWVRDVKSMPRYLVTSHGPALNVTPSGPRQRYGIDALMRDSLNRSAGAVAISSHAREVLESIGVDEEKIVDIPNGVEVARFRNEVSGFDLRSEMKLPGDAVVLLSVGRAAKEKAYGTALRAFARAAQASDRLYYVVVGRGTGGLAGTAAKLGISDRVRLHEGLFDERLVAAYQQADIFCLPSRKELCPLVVPEAMAAGLPAVVTNVSGSQDMVESGVNGLVVEPDDVEALAGAIRRLAADPDLRRRMGLAGSRRAEAYDWDRLSRRYLEYA